MKISGFKILLIFQLMEFNLYPKYFHRPDISGSLHACTFKHNCRCRHSYCQYTEVVFSGRRQVGRSLALEGQDRSGSLCCRHCPLLCGFVHLCNWCNLIQTCFSCLHAFPSPQFFTTLEGLKTMWGKALKVPNIMWELTLIFRAAGLRWRWADVPEGFFICMTCIKFLWLAAAASLVSDTCRGM